MTTTILIIAMIILGVSEVIFATGFYMLLKRIDKLDLDYDFFEKMHKIDQDYYKFMCEESSKMAKAYDKHTEIFKISNVYYDAISEQYNNIKKHYEFITNQHTILLTMMDGINERYDNAYEQFKLCTDELKKLEKQPAVKLYGDQTTPYPIVTQPYYSTVCSEDMEET